MYNLSNSIFNASHVAQYNDSAAVTHYKPTHIKLASISSESLGSHTVAPFRGSVACPIFAMREMMLALWVFGLLVSASDIDTPRALMLVSSVLQDEPQTTTLGGTKSQSLDRDEHSHVAVIWTGEEMYTEFW
jgi:hypothetical protein